MDVQTISSRVFSVYITSNELERRSIEPNTVTPAQAMELVSTAAGAKPLGTVKLELFPGRHELLIFVRKSAEDPDFFRFDSVECMIGAVLTYSGDDPASLFYYDGEYILAVWSWNNGISESFCEFGERLYLPGGFLLHLYEHGRVLSDGCAFSTIKSAFLRK